jgi:hypothetical protein
VLSTELQSLPEKVKKECKLSEDEEGEEEVEVEVKRSKVQERKREK